MIDYKYLDQEGTGHLLDEVTLAAVPNGKLQDRYNPNVDDNIWLAGRNAPTLGEDFRVRLSFERLKLRKGWRVQRIRYDTSSNECVGVWDQ